VRDIVLAGSDVWVACLTVGGEHVPAGWMALDGRNVDALFVDPTQFRRGVGSALLHHARATCGGQPLSLQVNEQNLEARRFYDAAGFVPFGRSPVDGGGRPFPVIHMREARGDPDPDADASPQPEPQ
jgi:putative acetyltransferase